MSVMFSLKTITRCCQAQLWGFLNSRIAPISTVEITPKEETKEWHGGLLTLTSSAAPQTRFDVYTASAPLSLRLLGLDFLGNHFGAVKRPSPF